MGFSAEAFMTDYNSIDEIVMAADSGTAGFSDDEAWAETKQYGEGQWKIVQVPQQKYNG